VPKQELNDRGQQLSHNKHSDLDYMCKKLHPAENCYRWNMILLVSWLTKSLKMPSW